ncbi:MAG: hypothetical protein ACPG32_04310 [Akkermansiaceae bacterium]
MKKTMIAGAAGAAVAMLAAPAYAELEGEISLDYQDGYHYRGVSDLIDQFTNANDTLTSSVDLTYSLNDNWAVVGGASFSTLSNTGFDHNSWRVGVKYTSECFTAELGFQNQEIETGFGDIDTGEIYLNLGTKCPYTGGNVNLFIANDSDVFDGTFVELSWNRAWELCDKCSVDVTAAVSYSFDYWDNFTGNGSDWNSVSLTVALPYQLTDNLVVAPYIRYSNGLDALDLGAIEEDDQVGFGVKATVKF